MPPPTHTTRLLKNGHLLCFPHPSSLRRTAKYASLLRISGALHLALFEQPGKDDFFSSLLLGEAVENARNLNLSKTAQSARIALLASWEGIGSSL